MPRGSEGVNNLVSSDTIQRGKLERGGGDGGGGCGGGGGGIGGCMWVAQLTSVRKINENNYKVLFHNIAI